jgi:hypothetical protein
VYLHAYSDGWEVVISLARFNPAFFQVYFMIDVTGKQKYLLHGLDGFIESLDGVELILT